MSETLNINFNSYTYDLQNPNAKLKVIKQAGEEKYQTTALTEKKVVCNLRYRSIHIRANNIHFVYIILQHIMNKTTLLDLSKCAWDYSKWNVEITSNKKLPDWGKILNHLLNDFENFNKPIKIKELEKKISLNDKRGWGGERPREVYYAKGFPFYTSKTKKSLSNSERLFECPFPICRINPNRKAIVNDNSKEKKCFTCGIKEGEKNRFGNICKFEKGHFEPHINGGAETAGHQCKWCNSFYKDKITWNAETGKPTFNAYAIIRDAPTNEIIKHLKTLGFTSKDLE